MRSKRVLSKKAMVVGGFGWKSKGESDAMEMGVTECCYGFEEMNKHGSQSCRCLPFRTG